MDTVPELEETPLKLKVVIDPKTKCATMMTTRSLTISHTTNPLPGIIPKDPLQKEDAVEPDFEKMTELDKLIYSERQRLLQVKKPIIPNSSKKVNAQNNHYHKDSDAASSDESDDIAIAKLTKLERQRIRQRKRRARETDDERDNRKFRQRIFTMKMRLLQRLKNFDNESYMEEIKKQNTEKIRQRRLEKKLNETAEEKEERKNKSNMVNRQAKLRRRALMTAEDLKREREKKSISLKNCLARMTEEERRTYHKRGRDQAKERYRKNNKERKKYDLILQGKSIEEIEAMDDDVKFKQHVK